MPRITKNKKLMLEKYDPQKSYSLEEGVTISLAPTFRKLLTR